MLINLKLVGRGPLKNILRASLGFTLIELLAVIVILAIIAVIAVPIIIGIIEDSKKEAFKNSAYGIIAAAKNEYMKSMFKNEEATDMIYTYTDSIETSSISGKSLNYDGAKPKNGMLMINTKGEVEIYLHDGTWCVTKSFNQKDIMIEKKNLIDCVPDTLAPTVDIVTNGSNDNPATTIVNVVDSGSDLDVVQYKWDISVTNPTEGWTVFNTGDTLSFNTIGTYYLHIRATDKARNTNNVVSNPFIIPKLSFSESKGVNVPQLVKGMTPIKWDTTESKWLDTTEDDNDWYSYTGTDKKWANVRTNDGSMWVWIPRYAYQIATNYHTSTAGIINIKFLKQKTNISSDNTPIALTPTYTGNSQTNYVKHPAFKFGDDEILGFWVAKFEISGTINSLDSKPGVESLRSQALNDIFIASRNMETKTKYGWDLASELNTDKTFAVDNNIDTHVIRNIEWGAVAYLTQSGYGKNSEVSRNANSYYITGSGTGTTYTTQTSQSTTGTIYGIYDMSGGSYETSNETSYKNSWYGDYSAKISETNPWIIRSGFYNETTESGIFAFYYAKGSSYPHNGFRVSLIVGEGL